ncbi:hypothetical protein ACFIQF_00060 [Comamonas sp. J-3]|uniref:hypothetical protein n=1 Tax=Comamonas trifloxystrobinivorans TaxID=3350256 RepID=UPI0037283DF5
MLKNRSNSRQAALLKKLDSSNKQRGVMIIEAMVAILLVMLGMLGIAGLTAKSTTMAGQAQYRTEAGMYADQIVQMIALRVDRSSNASLATSLQAFEHQATGGDAESCEFSGSATSDTALSGVLKAAEGQLDGVAGLPGATSKGQQVRVETNNNLNRVTVTLCWQGPGDAAQRNYQIQAFVH